MNLNIVVYTSVLGDYMSVYEAMTIINIVSISIINNHHHCDEQFFTRLWVFFGREKKKKAERELEKEKEKVKETS